MESWSQTVPAILLAWYPGMEGGRAIADVLLGRREPGGRLPLAIPRDAEDLPPFDPDARHVRYDRWVGQRRLDRDGGSAAFPFGYGLGYTRFSLDKLALEMDDGRPVASVRLRNTGRRRGATVVQLYALAEGERPVHELVGFARVAAEAGGELTVKVPLELGRAAGPTPPSSRWRIRAGQFAGDPRALEQPLRVPIGPEAAGAP
jgi:beta-glucosidase